MRNTYRYCRRNECGQLFFIALVLTAAILCVWLISRTAGSPAPRHDAVSAARSAASSAAANDVTRLVNKAHPLPAGYRPTLTSVPLRYYVAATKDNRFDVRAAAFLTGMLDAAALNGTPLVITSGYRSGDYQQMNFQRKLETLLSSGVPESTARSAAADVVAPAGQSEHETGLAVDLVPPGWFTTHTDLTSSFDETPAFRWLVRHCAAYGFILRYPKGKETVTGYVYEPWHYRFVGLSAARSIMQSGLCLEEYLTGAASGAAASGNSASESGATQ